MPLDVDNVLLDLVKGQAKTQQMVSDMSTRLLGGEGQPGVLKLMHDEHKEQFNELDAADKKTDERVDTIEKKMMWYSGAGTAVGGIIGYFIQWFSHRGGR